MATVSVIIPVYQSAHTISEAIDSVLGQSFKDVEIVVIDDGSTDSLEEVLIAYGDQVRLIKQNRLGVSAARNNGIRNSTGDILAFLDADDIWLPDKLSQQMALLGSDPDLGVVYGNVRFWDGKSLQKKTYFDLLQPHRGQVLLPLFAVDFVPLLSILVPRMALNSVGLFDESVKFVEDYELLLRLSLKWKFDYIEHPVGAYRISGQQVSKNFTQVANSLLQMKESFFLENADLLQQAHARIIHRGLYNKYLRLALWHIRDGNSAEARSVLNRYRNLRGVSLIYIAFLIFMIIPPSLRLIMIRLWESWHQKPELGMY